MLPFDIPPGFVDMTAAEGIVPDIRYASVNNFTGRNVYGVFDRLLLHEIAAAKLRLGATAEMVHSGLPYDIPQSWAKALHAHPVGADGIAYQARHDDEALCYALFDAPVVPVAELRRETKLDRDWFWQLAEPYGIGLAPG
jgi:hypothetical protein